MQTPQSKSKGYPSATVIEMPSSKEKGVKVICAWCGKVLKKGGGKVSHGICTACAKRVVREGREAQYEEDMKIEAQIDAELDKQAGI